MFINLKKKKKNNNYNNNKTKKPLEGVETRNL